MIADAKKNNSPLRIPSQRAELKPKIQSKARNILPTESIETK